MKYVFNRLSTLILFWVLLMVFTVGCDSKTFDVDTSNVKVDNQYVRFDSVMFHQDWSNPFVVHPNMMVEYPNFYPLYVGAICQLGNPRLESTVGNVMKMMSDPYFKEAYAEELNVAGDLNDVTQELRRGWDRYSYHFKGKRVPDVFYFFSGFKYPVAVDDSLVGIGVDWFMGRDHEMYQKIQMPLFQRNVAERPYMAAAAIRGWSLTEFDEPQSGQTLLDYMIYYGKVMTVVEACLYEQPDYLLIGFTPEQITWCENSEGSIFARLIEEEVLYSKSQEEISKLMNDAPFTPGMPRESPGRIGVWVGWQMVRSYLEEFPETTLQELFEMKDSQVFLQKSKYKPRI